MTLFIVDFTTSQIPSNAKPRGRPVVKQDKMKMFIKSSQKFTTEIKFKPITKLDEIYKTPKKRQLKKKNQKTSTATIETNLQTHSTETKPTPQPKPIRTSISIKELLN